jgi:hypothetical protein
MDNKKFEQLIDMIINEEEDKARALFHDIVVEKSREIYESIMEEEALEEMGMGGASGQLIDEIGATIEGEEEGMSEEDEEFADIEIDDEDGMADEFGDEESETDELEDRVVDLEDKLDQLMAEFEELMGQDDEMDDMGDMDDEDMMEAAHDDEEDVTEGKEEEDEEDMSESLEEAISLKQVPGLYGSKIGGDDGSNSKSVALTSGPKVKSTGAKPVNFSGESSTGGTKGGLASPDTKDVKDANNWKNRPAQGGMNLEKAPKPKHGDNGSNTKSPLGESKASVKKRIK